MENKPKVYFVLGGPGAGKGTQSQKLVEKFGFVHLSAGDLLRAERKSGSSNGDLIESCITQGMIVPSHITVALLWNAMKLNGLDKTYLIDGFPRNQENFESWVKTMGDSYHFKKLLFFDCDEKIMMDRIMKRSEMSGRSDDNTQTLIKRFKVYKEETKPIIDYFQSLGQVIILMAEGSQDEVFNRLVKLLEEDGQ